MNQENSTNNHENSTNNEEYPLEETPGYLRQDLPFEERKHAWEEMINEIMNPFPEFDPNNFEPFELVGVEKEIYQRCRVPPPKILPTMGLYPKTIREGQMIGMYESPQDLYLIFAHRCNELQAEIDELKNRLNELEINNS